MASDIVQRVREAIVSALDTASTLTSLTGRASVNVVPYEQLGSGTLDPVLAYFVVVAPQTGADGDTREFTIQFTAFVGKGNSSLANALLEAVETLLTATALLAAGVDGAPMKYQRQESPPDNDTERSQAILDVTLLVNK